MDDSGPKVHLLFFGATVDAVGFSRSEIEIGENQSVGALISALTSEYPRLLGYQLLTAVNEEYAGLESQIKDGDELAIFTPVSGG